VQQMEFLVQVAVYTAIDYMQRALSHSHFSRQNEEALFYLALIAIKTLQGGASTKVHGNTVLNLCVLTAYHTKCGLSKDKALLTLRILWRGNLYLSIGELGDKRSANSDWKRPHPTKSLQGFQMGKISALGTQGFGRYRTSL
jgi:hypothetical protein